MKIIATMMTNKIYESQLQRCYFVSQLCGIKGDDIEGKVQGKTEVYAKDDKKDNISKNNGHYYIASSNQGIVRYCW